jgi:hypothetical protein
MNRVSKLFTAALLFVAASFMVSCEDDLDIGGGDGLALQDGFYITQVDVDPVTSSRLSSTVVEADGFGSQAREGFRTVLTYLAAGNYNIVNVVNREIRQTIGGSTETIDGGSDCDQGAYTLVSSIADGGAAFNVASAGFYWVMMDDQRAEAILYRLQSMSLIGAATPAGWSHSADQTVAINAAATGVTAVAEGITLRPGEYKVRFNCRWGIDRRINPEGGFAADNGYVAFTNFGGTFEELVPGGANFQVATGGDGVYKFTASWNPEAGFGIAREKTQDLEPIQFNPSNFQWGIIGAGGPTGNWDNDEDLNYEGVSNGAHRWVGTFDVNGEFKFRTNNSWDFNIGYQDNVERTGDVDGVTNTGGNFTATGNYTFTISTSNEGESWSVNFKLN